jgi:hypothetical protein
MLACVKKYAPCTKCLDNYVDYNGSSFCYDTDTKKLYHKEYGHWTQIYRDNQLYNPVVTYKNLHTTPVE